MNKAQAKKLRPGLYTVWWKEGGGVSYAAVGIDEKGDRWLAPSAWAKPGDSSCWRFVDRVLLLAIQ